jgi:hypothetical protein
MRAIYAGIFETQAIRLQPWTQAEYNPNFKWVNFRHKEERKKIRTYLEDFIPYSNYEGVQRFYDMMDWLNGDESQLETTDSRLEPPKPNSEKEIADKELVLIFSLTVFFRKLELNLSADSRVAQFRLTTPSQHTLWLAEQTLGCLELSEPYYAVFKTYLLSTKFTEAPVASIDQCGYAVAYKLWTWGDTEQELFDNYKAAMESLFDYFKNLPVR